MNNIKQFGSLLQLMWRASLADQYPKLNFNVLVEIGDIVEEDVAVISFHSGLSLVSMIPFLPNKKGVSHIPLYFTCVNGILLFLP